MTLSPDLNTLPSIHPPSSLTNRVCVFWPSLFAIALTVKPHGEKEGRRVMGSLVSGVCEQGTAKWNGHGNRLFVLRYGSGRDGRCFKKRRTLNLFRQPTSKTTNSALLENGSFLGWAEVWGITRKTAPPIRTPAFDAVGSRVNRSLPHSYLPSRP